jgi:hypothetical protein
LRDNFSTPNPILYKDGVGQFDNQNNLLQEFVCKYDCIKTLHMSDKTLAKALDKNVSYNGYYYKSLGSKLQCIISQWPHKIMFSNIIIKKISLYPIETWLKN